MDIVESNTEGFTPSSSTHFLPLARPRPLPSSQNSSSVIIRHNRRHSRIPRPHSIGAGIISNPKLVKGWQYYDNSPNQRNIRKYLSTINIPCEEIDSDCDSSRTGGTTYSNSPYRDSYRRGVGVIGPDEDGDGEDDYIAGVEVQACVAPDSDVEGCDEDDDTTGSGGHSYLGIILTIVASSALALASVLTESMIRSEDRPKYKQFSVSVWSFQGILLPSLALYLFSLCRVEGREKETISIIIEQTTSYKRKFGTALLILSRAVLGTLGVILKEYSMERWEVPFSNFTVIMFTSPIFILGGAWCYLKERMSLVTLLIGGVVLVGVGVMMKPTFVTGERGYDRGQLIGTGIAIGCMLLEVISVIILRYIRTTQYALITLIYGIVGTLESLLACYVLGDGFQFPAGVEWVIGGLVAGLMLIGHTLITLALKYEQAGVFALVRSWEVPVMVLCHVLIIRGEKFDIRLSLIGASLVTLGLLLVIMRKWIQSLSKSTRTRRWCRCLLL